MGWRVAGALEVLLQEINAAAPRRSKVSDGSIGDVRHASRTSDHNPWVTDKKGTRIVTARDFTHDPAGGFDAYKFFDHIRAINDPRVKYAISNGRIWSPDVTGGAVRKYTGTNKHDHHTHVSVDAVEARFDDKRPWDIGIGAKSVVLPDEKIPISPPVTKLPQLKSGDKGESVKTLQKLLTQFKCYAGAVDGYFGPTTKAAVRLFQKLNGLTTDGLVGAYTWIKLNPPSVITAVSSPGAKETMFSAPFPSASEFGLSWGRTFEHFEAKAYPDPTPEKAAQGFGHNAGSGIPPIPVIGSSAWSLAFAEEVFKADVELQERYLNYYVKVPLAQRMIDALVLDVFKLGPGNFKKDKVLEALNQGNYDGAAAALRNRPSALGGVRRRYGKLADIFEGKQPDPKSW